MGGADSEVTAATTRMLLEVAWFLPRRVRRGSRALGLSTEASKRFERGVDPAVGPIATARFLELLRDVAPGARAVSACTREAAPVERRALALRPSRCDRIIGASVPPAEQARLLGTLEFDVRPGDPHQVTVPSWRVDVEQEDDLVEEVARAWGYDRIPEAPLETHGVFARRSERERVIERARVAMLARGLTEAWCTTLVTEREAIEAAALLGEEPPRLARLVNPMSREGEVLRPNLLPGLLRACAHNLKQGVESVRLFEVGAGFRDRAEGLPEETLMLGALVAGPRWAHAHDASQGVADFDDAKGLWEAWLEEMRVDTPEWRSYAARGWKPGASAEVASGASRIAWAGTLSAPLLRGWDIEVPVHLFLVLLDPLVRSDAARASARLPGRFPPVRRDLAFFVPERISHRELEAALARAAGEWLDAIELFDVYAGTGTPTGMKSLAFALRFQHPDRTLNEAEVQAIQERMVTAVRESCGGQLREK
jgi:phenylalanyl-tRNA synthetase beta chain